MVKIVKIRKGFPTRESFIRTKIFTNKAFKYFFSLQTETGANEVKGERLRVLHFGIRR